jgi:hypothetical protein
MVQDPFKSVHWCRNYRNYGIYKIKYLINFFCDEGPRSRCYGRPAALRLIVQPCDEDG